MNKFYGIIMVLFTLCFVSCSSDDETRPENYLTINGTKHIISTGTIIDWGTDSEIEYRKYSLKLKDKLSNPANYINFSILSNSTKRLEEGEYTYQYLPEKGVYTNLEIGYDLEYDADNERIKGSCINEYNMENRVGTIKVSQEDGDYRFDINMTFDYKGQSYTVQSCFWDVLTKN